MGLLDPSQKPVLLLLTLFENIITVCTTYTMMSQTTKTTVVFEGEYDNWAIIRSIMEFLTNSTLQQINETSSLLFLVAG